MRCVDCKYPAEARCDSCDALVCEMCAHRQGMVRVCWDALACELRRLEAAGWLEVTE